MRSPGPAARLSRGIRQQGTSLAEVLVTMLLLAIGLLGVAGMHVVGLKNTMNANLRTQASILAYDIADRMRANRPNAFDYQISLDSGIPETSSVILDIDLHEWKTALAASLPGGDGAVVLDGDRFLVTIQWVERVGGAVAGATALETRQYELAGEL
jgi:type IV pilus assembly protein PilV